MLQENIKLKILTVFLILYHEIAKILRLSQLKPLFFIKGTLRLNYTINITNEFAFVFSEYSVEEKGS